MAKAKTNSAAGNLNKGNAIVNNTNRKFDSDNLQDLLEDAASVLESISGTGKKKAAITKLCGIFRSGDLKIAEQPTVTSDQGRITQVFNFGLDISDEEAQEISSYLTIGEGDEAEVYVAAEDVRDVSKLMDGIKRYVETTNNALLISGNISDSRARQIEELTERARTFDAELSNMREQYDSAERSFVNERNAKEAVEGKFKRYKR